MNKLKQINKLIGNTPLIRIKYKYENKIRYAYFKLEWYNLTGSIKDRVAYEIIKSAYLNKSLTKNQTIVETTSGNMGISLSAIATYLGHKVVIFMPKDMSIERQKLLKLYGAKLITTNTFKEAFNKAKEYANKHNAFMSLQFDNENNFNAHYFNTAIEIKNKIKNPKYFISGIGTSGTLMGIGKYLKEHYKTKLIELIPKGYSPQNGINHKIQGISDGVIPKIYDNNIIDYKIEVDDNDAIAMSIKLSKELGLGVGISSGANMVASVLSNKNNTISVFPDDNKKYLSTDLSSNIKSELVDKIELINYKVI